MDMEVEFLNLGLDIIGLGVFNYDFGSITTESPVIKARRISCWQGFSAPYTIGRTRVYPSSRPVLWPRHRPAFLVCKVHAISAFC